MNVNLGPQWETFIDDQIKTGRYLSASELVRDGLRLLQEKEQIRQWRLDELRKEIQKGLDSLKSGDYIDLDEQGMKEHMEGIKMRGRARLALEQAAAAK